MADLLHAVRLRERLLRVRGRPEETRSGRVLRLHEDRLVAADLDAYGREDVVSVPSEHVLLLAVALPPGDPRRRREALPFAVEERIADPLDRVHVALGREIAPRLWLAAVVRHEVMAGWLAALDTSGVGAAPMIPDALLLPLPAEPEGWIAAREGPRVLVRRGDGTGFAVAAEHLGRLWEAAGRPPCTAYGADVADLIEMRAVVADRERRPVPLAIDLRQGRYAYRRPADTRLRRRILAIAAMGLGAHLAIATADTLVLRHQAAVRGEQARALVAAALPGTTIGTDPMATLSSLPLSATYRTPDPLLPLLARVFAAAGPVAMQALSYERSGQRLVLRVEPGREGGLAARLGAAGLTVTSGGGSVTVLGSGA